VLGRILRINNAANQEAWLYTFAEPSLITFAEDIEKDIPESCQFIQSSAVISNTLGSNPKLTIENQATKTRSFEVSDDMDCTQYTMNVKCNILGERDFDELILGEFKQRVISAFL
jgi:hypothetical protein